MNNKHCDSCYFGEVCPSDGICEDYISLDEQFNDESVDNLIEQRRIEFRKEWHRYITRWDT